MTETTPTLMPLGDHTILLRFASAMDDATNRSALGAAAVLSARPIFGVTEIVPSLVSVSIHYDPHAVSFSDLAGQVRLKMSARDTIQKSPIIHNLPVRFDKESGPDLVDVAKSLNMSVADFIAAHNASNLRVVATGFAPGFIYCGMHPDNLHLPRRQQVRKSVPPGTVLFAAGQTAITSTTIPTGWHVIGHTDFNNFDVTRNPPTSLNAGDEINFTAVK